MTDFTLRDCPGCGRPLHASGCWRHDCIEGAVNIERERRRRGQSRAAQARRDEVRRPPAWPGAKVPGVCNLCCQPVTGRRKTWCSQRCVDLWWLMTSSATQTAHLRLTFEDCWQCGTVTRATDVDHIRPLWSLDYAERHEYKWWLPFNLQLLCHDCHKAKTRVEAAERAALRRGQSGPALEQSELELVGDG